MREASAELTALLFAEGSQRGIMHVLVGCCEVVDGLQAVSV